MIQETIDLVKRFEGYRDRAYKCPAGVWTIGYGTIRYPGGRPVKSGDVCTTGNAESWLKHELEYAELKVHRLIKVPLTSHQIGALTSFVYNLGSGAFRASTLRRRINSGDFEDVPYQFKRWVHGGGRILRGLVIRRQAEVDLYQVEEWSDLWRRGI